MAAMVLGMVVAARFLAALARPELMPAVVAVLVGAHCLPLEAAFHAPVFTRVGAALVACGVAGVLAGVLLQSWWAAAAAAVGGLAMLVVLGVSALRTGGGTARDV